MALVGVQRSIFAKPMASIHAAASLCAHHAIGGSLDAPKSHMRTLHAPLHSLYRLVLMSLWMLVIGTTLAPQTRLKYGYWTVKGVTLLALYRTRVSLCFGGSAATYGVEHSAFRLSNTLSICCTSLSSEYPWQSTLQSRAPLTPRHPTCTTSVLIKS